MVAATEKQLYLCSSCRRAGVKSKNSKVFDTFFCPRCKCETTLFLPNNEVKKVEAIESLPTPPPPPLSPIYEENEPKKYAVTQIVHRRAFTIRDFFIFMVGFVAALVIIKTR